MTKEKGKGWLQTGFVLAPTRFQPALPLYPAYSAKPLEPLDAYRITQAKETITPLLTYMEAGRGGCPQPDLPRLNQEQSSLHRTALEHVSAPNLEAVEIRNQKECLMNRISGACNK
ncbi:hypothetical protein [Nitrosospira multiformis]|uniref:Uncharacterized protein n=1 Tax=Nitrosospira multiformis (strain ATCC 25196 / NCIMB 11849 / C 71) TaxID=323848 RepID=Q2YCE4_NITMU|nr:hypothetical protein [Nitrosospira multiformis]ABB73577.1 hypothetical protein Nmul_A0269 [Nitrosospira multiformis ATCC 25196]SDZ77517.1 hypothetical protein SAMN05216411_101337 [Nitrosospira multiformis]SEF80902.1 hypothetical protein SAMN05216403_11015 [Nitrosospira multiformis ATCC 25196]